MDVISEILTSVFVSNPRKHPTYSNASVNTDHFELESRELEPPVETEMEPPVENEMEPPVETEMERPVENEMEPPVENEMEAPVENQMENEKDPVVSNSNELVKNSVTDIISNVEHFLLVNQSNERNLTLFKQLVENLDNFHKTLYILSDNKELVSDVKKFVLDTENLFESVKQVDLEYLGYKRKSSKKWIVVVDYDFIDEAFLSCKTSPFHFVVFVDRFSSEIWNFTNHLNPSLLSYIPKGKIANRTLYKKVLRDFAGEVTEEIVAELAGKSIITYDNKNLVLL